MTPAERVTDLGFDLAMATLGRAAFHDLLRRADRPEEAQRETLKRFVRCLKSTAFGRSLKLGRFDDPDAFRANVPIHDYEALRPWVDRQIGGEAGAISPGEPVMYARTSGTTGAPKLIPVTGRVAHDLRRAQRAMAYAQHRGADAFRGKVLAIAGVSREVTLPDGNAAGATTGLIYETMPALMRAKYVVPAAAFGIEDADLKYEVLGRLALQHGDLSVIATANPSTILRFAEVLKDFTPSLIEEIKAGGFAAAERASDPLRTLLLAAVRPAPRRAEQLKRLTGAGAGLRLADLWPGLRAVVTWTQGSCSLAAAAVSTMLPSGARIIEAGYVASEARGTVVVDVERGLGFPLIEDVFFEFVPVEAWDAGERETLLLHQIEPGREYQILLTTGGGLVRYHMNDVVRATERVGHTPTLAFVRKGRGVTSITGEKLTEDQVGEALQAAAQTFGVRVGFYVFLADDVNAGYVAHVVVDGGPRPEALAEALDQKLAELNIEYASKRKSGRLRPLHVHLLRPQAASAYRAHLVGKGQREAQLKVLTLQRIQDCDFDFNHHGLAPRDAA